LGYLPGSMRIKRAALSIVVFAMVVGGVPLTPGASALTLGQIRARIQTLRTSLERVGNDLSRAEDNLAGIQDQIAVHYTALRTAGSRLAMLQDSLGKRAANLYIMGGDNGSGVLEDMSDFGAFIDRLTYLEQLGFNERGLVEEIRALEAGSRVQSAQLQAAENEARKTKDYFAAKQKVLEAQLAEFTKLNQYLTSFLPKGKSSRRSRGLVCPVVGPHVVVNNFGQPRPGGPHQGDDIRAATGQYSRAALPATVVDTPTGSWWGIGIKIRDLSGTEWWYAHMSARFVHVGQKVAGGEYVGRVGCTGRCYGSHLHFEWHPGGGPARNPYRILSSVC
jgi:murein DD-endopeptidase MepM/ murein hydrolase activator NlpD